MPKNVFSYKTIVKAPLEEVWSFFSTAENLVKITSFPKITILSDPQTNEGNEIEMALQFPGLKMNWVSLIEKVEAPNVFVDKGVLVPFPFKEWRHIHSFFADKEHTRMEDRVIYQASLPRFMTEKILLMMFKERERALSKQFS